MSKTIAELASEAYGYFERSTRDNGGDYVRTKDDAPDWIGEMVRAAHGDMLPDDWRYDCVWSALAHIGESGAETSDDLDDDASAFADANVDPYTANRLAWLASHSDRLGYVDQAREDGLVTDDADVISRVGIGQYLESEEVFASVRQSLAERLEELAGDDDD